MMGVVSNYLQASAYRAGNAEQQDNALKQIRHDLMKFNWTAGSPPSGVWSDEPALDALQSLADEA